MDLCDGLIEAWNVAVTIVKGPALPKAKAKAKVSKPGGAAKAKKGKAKASAEGVCTE